MLSGGEGRASLDDLERDRAKFEAEFPELRGNSIQRLTPFRYLIRGGVSMRNRMPSLRSRSDAAQEAAAYAYVGDVCFDRDREALNALIMRSAAIPRRTTKNGSIGRR